MKTTEYLDAVKTRLNLPSDYRLAKVIGVNQQAISKQRTHNGTMSDETALRVAELLDIEPLQILAHMHADRAQSDVAREAWQSISEKFSEYFKFPGAHASACIA